MSSYTQYDTDPWADVEAVETRRLDADLEMAEMNRVGDASAAAKRAGRCTHGSAREYLGGERGPGQEGLKRGQSRCTAGCGMTFADDAAWYAAIDAALDGFA